MDRFCIFATSRSGSSYFTKLVHQYLVIYENYNEITHDEFWNYRTSLQIIDNKIVSKFKNKKFPNIEEKELKILKKIQLLEQIKPKKYLFKVLVGHLSLSLIDYLNENYKFLLLERRDKFDQLLSNLLAEQTDQWNFYDNNKPIYQPITGKYAYFLKFEWEIMMYKMFKLQINNIHKIVFYEDLYKTNILKIIGFNKPINIDKNQLPKKMLLLEEKKKLFKNLEEVKTWFNQSKILNG